MLALLLPLASLTAQTNPDWTAEQAPFQIMGNLYYVGSRDLAAYLVTTKRGNILINANLASSVPQIRKSIETLGFRFSDIKILLNSQAHFDHTGGTAEIKRLTHAKLEIMKPDVSVVESGGKDDFCYFNRPEFHFEPVKVDRVLHDGDRVILGRTTLVGHLTGGHTKGCTTWTMRINDGGHSYDVLILGGATMNEGNNLIDDLRYPNQAKDFLQTFRTLKSLPCDVFLGAHGIYFDLQDKVARLKPGGPNPFIDPAGYKEFIEDREKAFLAELAKQRAARSKAPGVSN